MYKVFVNEKKLSLTAQPLMVEKTMHYDGFHTIEIAIDQLENTSCKEVNIYSSNLQELWTFFKKFFKKIDAAGGVVSNSEKKILFIHRLGKWDMPKGKIEAGESLEQAALREVEEETGLRELVLRNFINHTFHIYTERNGSKVLKTVYWYRMDYLGTAAPVPQTEEGITEVSWKDSAEITNEVLPSTFQNIALILNEAGIAAATRENQ